MKTPVIYFSIVFVACISCTPMNRTIGIRQVYTYPEKKSFAERRLPDLTSILSTPSQVFMIESSADTILYGREGTIISIRPSCLRIDSSFFLYEGKIKIELKELYTKEALLRERACTVSNGSMLESDGSIYINAYSDNGAKLSIDCDDAIQIRLPKEVKENMAYFEGEKDENGNMNWTVSDSILPVYEKEETYYEYKDYKGEENFMIRVSETQNEAETYFFSIKNFGWINCDRFYEDSREKKDFIAQFILPSNEKNVAESYNYIVFDSLMSVIPIYKDASGHWVCPNLPLGEAITCISIQKAGNRLYYGSRKTHVGNWVLTVRLQEIKEQELEKLLELTL
jgi:hypothetical protein